MNKKWKVIIIISLVLFVAEITFGLLFLTPYYRQQRLFDSISAGQWMETKEIYSSLGSDMQKKAMTYMDDYAAYVCQRYIDGEISYEYAAAALDAINSIDSSRKIYEKYSPDLNRAEYNELITGLVNAGKTNDRTKELELQNKQNNLKNRMDSETRDKILVEILNEKYLDYIDMQLSYADIRMYCGLVSGISYYSAKDYSAVIEQNVDHIQDYRDVYASMETAVDNKQYLDALEIYCSVKLAEYDEIYTEKYKEKYDEAYEAGKAYYEDELDKLSESGEKEAAVELIGRIEQYYGADFDLSAVKKKLIDKWQEVYVSVVSNIDIELPAALETTDTGTRLLEQGYDKIRPDSVVLYDIDGNMIPEMILFNSAQLSNNYVGCFIYGFSENKAQFIDYVNLISFCDTSNLVAYPSIGGQGEYYRLLKYDGSSIYEISNCSRDGSTYYVNGAEVSNVDYLAAQSEIMSYESEKRLSNSGYVSLSVAENYILAY